MDRLTDDGPDRPLLSLCSNKRPPCLAPLNQSPRPAKHPKQRRRIPWGSISNFWCRRIGRVDCDTDRVVLRSRCPRRLAAMWIGRPPFTVSVAKIRRLVAGGGEPQRGSIDIHDGRPGGQIGQQASEPAPDR